VDGVLVQRLGLADCLPPPPPPGAPRLPVAVPADAREGLRAWCGAQLRLQRAFLATVLFGAASKGRPAKRTSDEGRAARLRALGVSTEGLGLVERSPAQLAALNARVAKGGGCPAQGLPALTALVGRGLVGRGLDGGLGQGPGKQPVLASLVADFLGVARGRPLRRVREFAAAIAATAEEAPSADLSRQPRPHSPPPPQHRSPAPQLFDSNGGC
jgi:hypothetical protein